MFGLDDIVGGVMKGVSTVIDRVIPDKNAREAAKEEIERIVIAESAKALSDQRDINKVEAASPSMFVAGWRPYVGWLCGATLTWQWFLAPILTWVMEVAQITFASKVILPALPVLGETGVEALLYTLLGVGTLRTAEKMTGSATTGVAGTIIEAAKGLIGKR